jgi:hypothetical protein
VPFHEVAERLDVTGLGPANQRHIRVNGGLRGLP